MREAFDTDCWLEVWETRGAAPTRRAAPQRAAVDLRRCIDLVAGALHAFRSEARRLRSAPTPLFRGHTLRSA